MIQARYSQSLEMEVLKGKKRMMMIKICGRQGDAATMGCGASMQPVDDTSATATTSSKPISLGDVLKKKNIKTVVFVRHAKTEPRDASKIAEEWGVEAAAPNANAWMLSDLSRELLEEGRDQCKAAKEEWFSRFKPCAPKSIFSNIYSILGMVL